MISKIWGRLRRPGTTLAQRSAHGSIWATGMKLFNRGLNFIRVIILARLLTPDDFGLFGIALLVLGTIDAFSETGIKKTLIQKQEDITPYLNTAWVIEIIKGCFIALLLFVFSGTIASLFHEPRAIVLLQTTCIVLVLRGFINVGIVYFYREIELHRQFLYETSAAVIDFIVSVLAAVILKNAIALILGLIAGTLARLVFSYILHPNRHKFEFKFSRYRYLYSFGRWVFGSNLMMFFGKRGADFVIGVVSNASSLGLFRVASSISESALVEPVRMINRVSLPVYAKIQSNIERLKNNFFRIIRLTLLIVIPLATGAVILVPEFTAIFLGQKWSNIIPALQILFIANFIKTTVFTGGSLFYGSGHPRYNFYSQLSRATVLFIIIYPFVNAWNIVGAAAAVLISHFVSLIVWYNAVSRILKAPLSSFIESIAPPLCASAVMGVMIIWLKDLFNLTNASSLVNGSFLLIAVILCGLLTYMGAIYVLNKLFIRFNNLEDITLAYRAVRGH